jgi:hypothetical protein
MPEKSGIAVTASADCPEPDVTAAAANAASKAKFRRRVFMLASVSTLYVTISQSPLDARPEAKIELN